MRSLWSCWILSQLVLVVEAMSRLDAAGATEEVRQATQARAQGELGQLASWREVMATLETAHRNVQRGLHPPIETETARSLGDHVTAMLDFLDAEVVDLVQHGKAAGSGHENIMAL